MDELANSWGRAWSGLALAGSGDDACRHVLAAYSEPHRSYHTLQHLRECLLAFESVRTEVPHPAEVELALWFHDAIYDVKRSDNEAKSAEWAAATVSEAGGPQSSIELVRRLSMATTHNALPQSLDEQFLVDIDLSILGASAARYAEFEQQVKDEYSFVPGFIFRLKRRSILKSFLDRKQIYSTAHFKQLLETTARGNLQLVVRGESPN